MKHLVVFQDQAVTLYLLIKNLTQNSFSRLINMQDHKYYLEIKGNSIKSILEQIDKSKKEAINKFTNGEIEESKRRILKSPLKDTKAMEDFFN